MKKLTALMLSSAMMLSLAACGRFRFHRDCFQRGCFFRGGILRGRFHRGGRFCRRCRADHRQRGKLTMSTNAAFPRMR